MKKFLYLIILSCTLYSIQTLAMNTFSPDINQLDQDQLNKFFSQIKKQYPPEQAKALDTMTLEQKKLFAEQILLFQSLALQDEVLKKQKFILSQATVLSQMIQHCAASENSSKLVHMIINKNNNDGLSGQDSTCSELAEEYADLMKELALLRKKLVQQLNK